LKGTILVRIMGDGCRGEWIGRKVFEPGEVVNELYGCEAECELILMEWRDVDYFLHAQREDEGPALEIIPSIVPIFRSFTLIR
jgi:hypothetical protein